MYLSQHHTVISHGWNDHVIYSIVYTVCCLRCAYICVYLSIQPRCNDIHNILVSQYSIIIILVQYIVLHHHVLFMTCCSQFQTISITIVIAISTIKSRAIHNYKHYTNIVTHSLEWYRTWFRHYKCGNVHRYLGSRPAWNFSGADPLLVIDLL